MHDEEIVLYFNEHRLDALRINLTEQHTDLTKELYKALELLYEQNVPEEERNAVEQFIAEQEHEEAERREAERRFAVYHIRENGEDAHFTSEYFRSPMQAAYRYRRYVRNELSDEPKTFADAFMETEPIPIEKFAEICDDMNSDPRVTALIEFDLDNDTVSVCGSSDNAWWTYSLHDFSVAAFKAYRSDFHTDDDRREIFENSLAGKEIDIDEGEAPAMQM